MWLIYKKGYDGNPEHLPTNGIKEGSVKFKEIDDITKAGILFNVIAAMIMLICIVLLILKYGITFIIDSPSFIIGIIGSFLVLFPHEILHALCFKEDVYLYTAWDKGMLFVLGLESMTKKKFIFMSLLPNIVFGFIPYVLALLIPQCVCLGVFGALCIGMGAGDYYNVYNALTQMPKGSYAYMHKMNTYWYLPDKNN